MPEKSTVRSARRRGKSRSTQAGKFVGEEMRHVKRGRHGAKSRAQAIAIGLSKARRSGIKTKRRRGTTRARNRKPVSGARSRRSPQSRRRSSR